MTIRYFILGFALLTFLFSFPASAHFLPKSQQRKPFFHNKIHSSVKDNWNNDPLLENFAKGTQVLMKFFDPNIGVWSDPNCVKSKSCVNGTGWWYWGNAAHILADYQRYALADHQNFTWAFDSIYNKNLQEMTSSGYFDDEGWWGLALIRLYQTTNNSVYLNQAKKIADDMGTRGRQSVCGNGGIFWDAAKTQVGAIANELYISLCGKIALIDDPDKRYLQNAINTWNWLNSSGLIQHNSLIIDHYNVINKQSCGDIDNATYTYINGVILSGLMDLAQLTSDSSYSDKAARIARAAMARFAPRGYINDDYSESNPKTIAEDGFLFKGIFVENLAYLALKTSDLTLKAEITALFYGNYNLLIYFQGSGKLYGYLWEKSVGVDNPADIVTHLSALYLIDGLVQLKYSQ